MNMTIAAYAYPIMFKNTMKKQLIKYYSKDNINELLKKITKEYKAVVKRAPEIGGNKNIFISIYLMSSYLIAAYKNTKNRLNTSDWDKIISDMLNSLEFIKKKMGKENQLSESYKNKIIEAGKWCKENEDKYPDNWQVELKDKGNPDLTHKVFTKCGLCALCKKEGVPEFTVCLCATDYVTVGFSYCKLERPTTLAKGDSCCDFYVTRL